MLNTQPFVSVIVPTYNRPDFLIKTMQSILDQTYTNLELIVISNGQSDENKRAVESIQDSRVRYADQNNSGGPASPRNHGMRLAKGEYIAVCDDDDLWLTNKLEKQIQAMQKNPKYGLSYTHAINFDEKGHEWSDDRYQTNASILRYKNAVPISSVMIRSDVYRELGGFDESKCVGDSEDYEFVLRYAFKTELLFINEKLMKYWAGDNRTTANNDQRTVKDAWKHFRDVIGCHYLVIKKLKLNPLRFVLPFFYFIKICTKSSAYIILKNYKQNMGKNPKRITR